MAEEVELKLALGRDSARRIAAHPRLAGLARRHEALTNTYYDTPFGELERQRMALRLRRTPERVLQTVKTAGQGSGGLSTRGEWEWEVAAHHLDLAGLKALAPMQALGDAMLMALVPRFTTDFERTSWLIEDAGITIEVALDQGTIHAGPHYAPIDELELELKSTTRHPDATGVLWSLAEALATDIVLRPANTSKAARGAALHAGHWPLTTPTDTWHTLPARARADAAIAALDAYADSDDSGFIEYARAAFLSLADDADLAQALRQPARQLAAALRSHDWLSPSFGQHSLTLLAALDRQ